MTNDTLKELAAEAALHHSGGQVYVTTVTNDYQTALRPVVGYLIDPDGDVIMLVDHECDTFDYLINDPEDDDEDDYSDSEEEE